MNRWSLLGLGLVWLAGCAGRNTVVVDGQKLSRVSMDFVGQPFAVRMTDAHPDPGSPSGGLTERGGRLSGNVCGLELVYDVMHAGDRTRLTGFINNGALESNFDVRDLESVTRVIEGQLARGVAAVRLELGVERLRGAVGLRSFDLVRQGDDYVGSVEYTSWRRAGNRQRAQAVVHGAEALWAMPPSAQAAVLPALLTCYGDQLEDNLREKVVVGIGGRQSWEADRVSAIYHGEESGQIKEQMIEKSTLHLPAVQAAAPVTGHTMNGIGR